MYVLAGSTDYDAPDWSTNSKLVRVKDAVTAGYGENIRFPMDGDAALLELASCIEEIPGQIEYAKVATLETEPVGDNCQLSSVAGFGIISNAPDSVRDDDGRRRFVSDIVHSYPVCRDSYIAGAYGWETANQGNPEQVDADTIIPEVYICTGGASTQSVCFGDSGSGYAVDLPGSNRKQLIGVVSFGIGEFCTTSADYNTRLSFRAPWMAQAINGFTQCPNWSWSQSFASWPVPAWSANQLSSQYTRSRCSSSSQWQCQSGECISKALVCNGSRNCSDGSDEASTYCSLITRANVVRNDGPSIANQMRMFSDDSDSSDSELQNELNQLLTRKKMGKSDSSVHMFDFMKADDSGRVSVVIAGVLKTAGKKARSGHQKGSQAASKRSDPEVAPKSNPIDCTSAMKSYDSALEDAKKQNTINDKWDPSKLTAACKFIPSCTGTRPNGQAYSDSKTTCEQLSDFMAWNVTLTTYAANFDKNFNSVCASGSVETTAIPTGTQNKDDPSSSALSTTKQAQHLIALHAITLALPFLLSGL